MTVEQINAALATALLRHGFIPSLEIQSIYRDVETYRELSVETANYFKSVNGHESVMGSLITAKCPACGGGMRVDDPCEDVVEEFGHCDTSHPYVHVTGTLVCATDPAHDPKRNALSRRVVFNGTALALLKFAEREDENLDDWY